MIYKLSLNGGLVYAIRMQDDRYVSVSIAWAVRHLAAGASLVTL